MSSVRTLKTDNTSFKLFGEGPRSILFEALFYLVVFLLTVALFYIFKPLYNSSIPLFKRGSLTINGSAARILTVFLLVVDFGFAFFLYKTGRLNIRWIIFLLLVAGIIIRIGYMLRTPANVRQYDTFSSNYNGHEAYARNFYETGELPSNNTYQFYHPPLNAFIQSIFMRITSFTAKLFNPSSTADGSFYALFSAGKPEPYITNEQYFLYQSCQILSVLYSVVTCVFSIKILDLFGFKSKKLVFAAAILIFFPRTFQFAGLLNNDALAFMFAILALYFALKWWKKGKHWVDILVSALFVGLGMCSKLSSATVCLPIAVIYLYEFIISLRKRENALPIKKLLFQYAAFLAVCAPIGLWFQVYAKVRFDQPFGYVFPYLNRALATDDVSLFERLFITFNKDEWFGSFFIRNFKSSSGLNNNYNLFNYSVRSSIFGEFGYWEGEPFAFIAMFAAFAFCLFSLIGLVYALVLFFKNDFGDHSEEGYNKKLDIALIAVLIVSQIGSMIFFYIKMPYSCTMDFRYIMPLILGIALSTPLITERLQKEGTIAKIVSNTMILLEIIFLVSSAIFYTLCV